MNLVPNGWQPVLAYEADSRPQNGPRDKFRGLFEKRIRCFEIEDGLYVET